MWADATLREDGFVTTPAVDFSTDAHAVVAEGIEIHAEGPDWVLPHAILGDARITVSSAAPIFLGIAQTADVERYLDGVSYSVVPDLDRREGIDLPVRGGSGPSTTPAKEDFWIASREGHGSQTITRPVSNGDWSVVVMNSDGSDDVTFRGEVGAEVPVLRTIAIAILIAGMVLLIIAIALIRGAVTKANRSIQVARDRTRDR